MRAFIDRLRHRLILALVGRDAAVINVLPPAGGELDIAFPSTVNFVHLRLAIPAPRPRHTNDGNAFTGGVWLSNDPDKPEGRE